MVLASSFLYIGSGHFSLDSCTLASPWGVEV